MVFTETELDGKAIRLLDTAKDGNHQQVINSLDEGVPVDVKDDRYVPWDITPLMHAAYAGHVKVVRTLLDRGASLEARDKNSLGEGGGCTALHYAARGKQIATIRLLAESGADVNRLAFGSEGTPMHSVMEQRERELDSIDEARRASRGPSSEEVSEMLLALEALLALGADPNICEKGTGSTPLSLAAYYGSDDLARVLLESGANVDHQDDQGSTAFVSALCKGHIGVCCLLIEFGCDVNLTDSTGNSPLAWAVFTNNGEAVQLLLQQGARVEAPNADGLTPLDHAIERGYDDIAGILRQAQV